MEVKGAGFLLWTKNMPAMILSNISTPLGIVNGAQGRVVDVIANPNSKHLMYRKYYLHEMKLILIIAEICRLDSLYTLCTHPPTCVLFEPYGQTNIIFPGLAPNVIPVFGTNNSVTVRVQNMSISRHQIPLTPAWAITDYKVQGSTCEAVILDLHHQVGNKNTSSHKRYCSIYVQLSRVKSLENVSLLRPISIHDVSSKPHDLLLAEDERLEKLCETTDMVWKAIESSIL